MLIADYNLNRVSAQTAHKGPEYLCPQCKKLVILKRGRIVVAHFSWSATNALAVELQHTSIGIPEIEARAQAYSRAGVAQIWLPFLSSTVLSASESRRDGTIFIEKYSPRPFEKWVHGFGGSNGMWMYVPDEKAFRHAKMKGHQAYVESSSWYGEGGEEMSAGGFYKWSKRYRELTLSKPYKIQDLLISIKQRTASSMAGYNWPAASVATFVPQ